MSQQQSHANIINNNRLSDQQQQSPQETATTDTNTLLPATTAIADDDEPSFLRQLGGAAISGMGMFVNAWVVMAIGNIKPILSADYPDCWGHNATACTEALRSSAHFSVFSGVIVGMIVGGYIGDLLGRRRGSILSSIVMLIGNILITGSYAGTTNVEGTFTMFSVAYAVFGLGIGAEYPLSAAAAAEKSEKEREERHAKGLPPLHRRGRKIILPFLMQGFGNTFNTLFIVILLRAFGQTTEGEYDKEKLELVWRLQYGVANLLLAFLIYYRVMFLEESASWQKMKERASNPANRTVFFSYYWHRLAGTALGWCVWDNAFYANKVAQSEFVRLFHVADPSTLVILEEALWNSLVALAGYFCAAAFADAPWLGRFRMQILGFTMMVVSYLVIAIWYDFFTLEHTFWLRILYYVSSFFSQFGPNATTFVLPAEVFPTHMRAFGHGLSGAAGPGVGAMVGALVVSVVSVRDAFWFSAGASIVGVLVTLLFVPDLGAMPLEENDEFWKSLMQRHLGRASTNDDTTYRQHLSLFERLWWYDHAIGERLVLQSPILGRDELAYKKRFSALDGGKSPSAAADVAAESGDGGAGYGGTGNSPTRRDMSHLSLI